jgi:hypothetical protein
MLRSWWKRIEAFLSGSKTSLLRRVLLTSILVVPALIFVAYQTWRSWEELRNYEWNVQPALWSVVFLGYTAALSCLLVAWNYIMGRLGKVSRFRTNARLYVLSGLSKRLPGFLWYMAGRALLYREEGVPTSISLTGSALELALTATSGLLAYFFTLPFIQTLPLGGFRLLIAGLLLVAGVALLQPAVFNRVLSFFLRRMGSQAEIQVTYRDILPPIPLYMLAWGIGGVVIYALSYSVYPLPIEVLPTAMSIWAASGTLTLLLSTFMLGFGTREIALSILLNLILPQPLAIVVALLFGLIYVLSELFWAGVLALWR